MFLGRAEADAEVLTGKRQVWTGVSVMEGLTSKHLCFSLVCNQAGGEVVTFWSKECISRGGEEYGDGHPEVDDAYLVGEKSISIVEYEDSATFVWDIGILSVEVSSVCQRVNQEACGGVETMWTQQTELAWIKLEEQVYTVEKRQEINLGRVFLGRAEADAEALTGKRQVCVD
uniref:Uncharacterized protein n=1 Tax=Brassica campestris TaxID=3711 RepID=M4EFE1_BRACM